MNRRHPSSPSPGKKRVNSTCQLLAGGIGVLLLWLLVGCGSGDPRADLVILNGAEPESIDPAVVTGQLEGRICYAIFEGLLHFDRFGKPQPGIAERWDLSNDGKTYTFHLRANAKWSNGDPVTANDFVQSWRRILFPKPPQNTLICSTTSKMRKPLNEGTLKDFDYGRDQGRR